MSGGDVQGAWRLTGSSMNCRSAPGVGDNIVHVFSYGDEVHIGQHVKNDWCLLSGPEIVKDAYIRLRNGSGSRCWAPVGDIATVVAKTGVAEDVALVAMSHSGNHVVAACKLCVEAQAKLAEESLAKGCTGEAPVPWIQGPWKLLSIAHNVRSRPQVAGSNVVHTLHSGDVIEIERHIKSDWVLLAGPPNVKGAYVRLNNGKSDTRCFAREDDASDAFNILLVGNGKDVHATYPHFQRFLKSGNHTVNLIIRHCSTVDWADLSPYDALVLSGGTGIDDAHVRARYKRAIRETNLPVLGICFGFQWICRSYWDAENASKKFHMVKVNESRARKMYDFNVPDMNASGKLTYHRMYGVAPECLADCLQDLHRNQGTLACVRHKTKPVMGTQGHPEMPTTSRSIQTALLKVFFDMIDEHRKTKQRSTAPEFAPAGVASALAGYCGGVEAPVNTRSLSGRSQEAEEEDVEARLVDIPMEIDREEGGEDADVTSDFDMGDEVDAVDAEDGHGT